MIVLSPEVVRFESHVWEDVAAVAVDHVPKRLVEEHSDAGPYAVFVDVPERTVQVKVQRRVENDEAAPPMPGDAGVLAFYTRAPGADLSRVRTTISCVLTSVRTELGEKGITRTLTFAGVSDGAASPITSTPAGLPD